MSEQRAHQAWIFCEKCGERSVWATLADGVIVDKESCPNCGGTGEGLSPLAQALLKAAQRKGMGWLDDYTTPNVHEQMSLEAYEVVRAIAELLHHTRQQAQREERERLKEQVNEILNNEPISTGPPAHGRGFRSGWGSGLLRVLALFNEGSGDKCKPSKP